MSEQAALSRAWFAGKEGGLCGREQARARALREVRREEGKSDYGAMSFVASRARKTKVGKPSGDHPTSQSIKELFERVDADPEWHPGKLAEGGLRGRKRALRGPKQTAIVAAAKRLKKQGEEPTYAAIAAACPTAALNPDTGQPVDKKAVYTVFREACFDEGADDPWDNRPRLSRNALDDVSKRRRWDFAKHVISLSHRPQRYYDNLVWCDLCNSAQSQNLRGPKHHLKLNSSDTARAWWAPVLTRGKLHIEPLPGDFPGETPLGAEIMAAKVRSALNVRFPGGGRQPRALFTDRGNGFYNAGSGAITEEYRGALRRHNLREVMLHETAASWMRDRTTKTLPKWCWDETLEAHRARLKACAAQINSACDVDGLRRELRSRVKDLDRRQGDRLAK
ncbi:unnamed protein product [Prorocentrum cordatum]|uniref:Integrase catalytic domain-containing protein n=1 Tax=Prorocentrum cordatum TaxID=2364126 RepID=A0ABN9Q9H1_9DINO|nr:unnamed protein product [Polarella glacialis]